MVAQPIGSALIKTRVVSRILGLPPNRSTVPVRNKRTSPSRRSALAAARFKWSAVMYFRGSTPDVQAGTLAVELRKVHAVDGRRIRVGVRWLKRINVRRPVIAKVMPRLWYAKSLSKFRAVSSKR